jgi:hypothetical protein
MVDIEIIYLSISKPAPFIWIKALIDAIKVTLDR